MNSQNSNTTHKPSVVEIKSGNMEGTAKNIQGLDNILQLIQTPDKLFSDKDSTIIKDSTTTSCLVFKCRNFEGGIFLKRFNVKGFFHILKNIFRSSRAKRDWETAGMMMNLNIPTPVPLLFLEEKKAGITFKSYFISGFLTNAVSLDEYIYSTFTSLDSPTQMSIMDMAALQIRFMHDMGICHGDLKAKNILIKTYPDNTIKLFFTDLDSTQTMKTVPLKKRARDIARLNCSFPDTNIISKEHRLWFMKQYAGQNNRKYLKKLFQYVMRFTKKKLARSGKSFNA